MRRFYRDNMNIKLNQAGASSLRLVMIELTTLKIVVLKQSICSLFQCETICETTTQPHESHEPASQNFQVKIHAKPEILGAGDAGRSSRMDLCHYWSTSILATAPPNGYRNDDGPTQESLERCFQNRSIVHYVTFIPASSIIVDGW